MSLLPPAKPSAAAVKAQLAKAKPVIPEKPTEKPAEKSTPAKPAAPADAKPLSYAAPEKAEPQSPTIGNPLVALANLFGSASRSGAGQEYNPPAKGPVPPDHWTAVYVLTAKTIFMPNGTKLEAHSGLDDRLDDPRYVNERMHGATPPHVYELQLREQLFHGVQALRLNPIGEGDLYGRTGLLAHRYMLGPNGDSNGCVSIKEYDAFLQAYRNGEIKRLKVVARLTP